jgi:DNA mismatch endonuclease (patch repair protein)
MDTRTSDQRRRIMQSVRQKDTGPELSVRKALHAQGYRYRVNVNRLPGKPDLVFPGRKKVIFVHGCFWHGHNCPKGGLPKSRQEYWKPKIEANKIRDRVVIERLATMGWASYTIWQCELKKLETVIEEVATFLGPIGQ